jgi:hypothetical protein
MRHRTAALITATTLVFTLGGTAAYATGGDVGGDAGGGKKPPAACGPDRPDSRLENALRDVKIALGANGGKLTDRIVAVFAKDMGLTRAQGRKVLEKFFGDSRPGPAKPGDKGDKNGKGKDGKGKDGDGSKGSKPGPQEKGGPKAALNAAQLFKAVGKPAGTKPGPCEKAGGKHGPGAGKPAGAKALISN